MKTNKLPKILSIFAAAVLVVQPIVSAASLQDKYEDITKQLNETSAQRRAAEELMKKYNKEAGTYQERADALEAKMALMDSEIEEKQLQIDQLQVNIDMLYEEILSSEALISQTEFDISKLEEDVNGKLDYMYLKYKTGIGEAIIDQSLDPQFNYKYQEYNTVLTDQMLSNVDLLDTKVNYLATEKAQLEEKKVAIQRDRQILVEERATLDRKRADLEVERQSYYNLQQQAKSNQSKAQQEATELKKEQAKLQDTQEELQRQIDIESGKIPVGGFVKAGTNIGFQGNTGHAFGSHLHFEVYINGKSYDPCTRLPAGPFSFCKGNGAVKRWPLSGSYSYTSSYGSRWGRMHYGIDIAGPHKGKIYAAHDGYLKKWFSKGCQGMSPCNYGGTYIAEVCQYADCNKGLKTRYLHLDPSSMKK